MTDAPAESQRVWRLPVRILHWGLATCVGIAWVTDHGPAWLHDWSGYAVLAVVGARLILGLIGVPAERFQRFVVGWRRTREYTRALGAGHEPRYLGHNPLGGWMIVALLSFAFATGISGWAYTTDALWGLAWVEAVHAALADILVVLIVLHVAGVVFTSLRHGENLAAAMIHGRKRRIAPRQRGEAVES